MNFEFVVVVMYFHLHFNVNLMCNEDTYHHHLLTVNIIIIKYMFKFYFRVIIRDFISDCFIVCSEFILAVLCLNISFFKVKSRAYFSSISLYLI